MTSGLCDRLGELADVALDPLALVGERELRAAVGEPLGDRPGDRALVGDAEDEPALAFEHGGDLPGSTRSALRRAVRVAVVTGASSGIGAALCRELAARGWHVVGLSARRPPDADEHEECDVADRATVEAVAARVLERHPRIDLLVNNAGIPARGASFLDARRRS